MQRKLCVIREDWHCQPWRQVPIRYHHTYTVVYAYSYTLINTTHNYYTFIILFPSKASFTKLNKMAVLTLWSVRWWLKWWICNLWEYLTSQTHISKVLCSSWDAGYQLWETRTGKKKRSNLSATENWCHHRYSQIDITNTKCWSPLHSPWLSEGWWDHTDSLRV